MGKDTDLKLDAKSVLSKLPVGKLGGWGAVAAVVLSWVISFTNARIDAEAALLEQLGEVKTEVVALRREVAESAEQAALARKDANEARLELAKRKTTIERNQLNVDKLYEIARESQSDMKAAIATMTVVSKQMERLEARLDKKD